MVQPLMQWGVPAAFVVAGLAGGAVAERLVLPRFGNAPRSQAGDHHLLVAALRGVIFLWFAVAGIYAAVLSFPLSPAAFNFIHKALLAILIPSGTLVLARLAGGFVGLHSRRVYRRQGAVALPSPSIITNLARLVVFVIGGLIVLQTLGIAITPILTALGVGGLAVALALQDTLSNLFSGLYIIAARQIKPGDYIKLNTGEEGYVVDITWRTTKIRDIPNNLIIVPNAKLASATITNYHLPDKELAVLVQVRVSYESDLRRVEELTTHVARETMQTTPGGVVEFQPRLRYHTCAENSINVNVILRAGDIADQYRLRHEFIKRLHERYLREGIRFRSTPEVLLKEAGAAEEPRPPAIRVSTRD